MLSTADNNNQASGRQLCAISFPWGLPGLDYDEFTLTRVEEESPYYFLQSAGQPEIGLLLLDPFVLFPDYEFELDDDLTVKLKISSEKQVAVFCTVNASRGPAAATVNLLAPIVVNAEQLLAKQVVLNDKRYAIRTPLVLNPGQGREAR